MEQASSFSLESDTTKHVFAQVRAGCEVAADQLFTAARDYLRRTAKNVVDSDIRGQISESDLIQDALILANQSFDKFDGETGYQFAAWLRRIFVNNLISQYRAFRHTKKRDLAIERRIDAGDVPGDLIATTSSETPSRVAIENEEHKILAAAMGTLSKEHRKVIELRHREHLPFKDIGERMNRTTDAARVLWYRAFKQLTKSINQVPPEGNCLRS